MTVFHSKKAKILCTIGPSSSDPETLQSLYSAGMDAVRINTSHGDFDGYRDIIEKVRAVDDLPIVMDTQGPKIRLRMSRALDVKDGEVLRVGFAPEKEFYLDANVYEHLEVGDRALIDDGNFEAIIEKKEKREITFRFKNGGAITSGRAVNFPRKDLPLDTLTGKDIQSLNFAREMDVDFIALSFTRGKNDIKIARYYLDGSDVKIIAKIENQQGVDNFKEILELSDGIMVARGDMGVELDPEEIPIIQKRLINLCNQAGKPVITATQMLQSMVDNPRPTRAETSDVANAILDGSDVVMLSGETANGNYPIQSVQMMNRIAKHAEKFITKSTVNIPGQGVEQALCDSIKSLCELAEVDKIITVTRRGSTAKLISRLRLQQNILAITGNPKIFRELHMHFGIHPVMIQDDDDYINAADAAIYLHRQGYIHQHEMVLITSAEFTPSDKRTNTIQIVQMGDLIKHCERTQSCKIIQTPQTPKESKPTANETAPAS